MGSRPAEETQAVSTITEAMAALSSRLRDLEAQLLELERRGEADERMVPTDVEIDDDGLPLIAQKPNATPQRSFFRAIIGGRH